VSLSLSTRAAVNTPAEHQVALATLSCPGVPAFPTIPGEVGLRITVFGVCSTFTARCGPRSRQATQGGPLHRRLRSLRYLHDHSDCYRLERQLPGGSIPHWESARFHGARESRLAQNKAPPRRPRLLVLRRIASRGRASASQSPSWLKLLPIRTICAPRAENSAPHLVAARLKSDSLILPTRFMSASRSAFGDRPSMRPK
jgi:hypothetical protein